MAKEELTKNKDRNGGKVKRRWRAKEENFHVGNGHTSSKAEVRTEKTSLMIWGWGEERPHYSSLMRK